MSGSLMVADQGKGKRKTKNDDDFSSGEFLSVAAPGSSYSMMFGAERLVFMVFGLGD